MTTSSDQGRLSMMEGTEAVPSGPTRPQKNTKHKDLTSSTMTDEFIMDTNNSSIVSKRSVEKLYYQGRKEYLRHFVRKFQRRSPLINRGYWLRMKAVDSAVRKFLNQDQGETKKRKIIVNLGCGYDPNPFEYLGREPALCADVTFVDVDYPQLIHKKYDMIKASDTLIETVPDLQFQPADSTIIAKSNHYLAVGCDLRELDKLDLVLRSEFDMANTSILFTAEVSVAYLTLEAANAVFTWTATFDDALFCLLEQHIPDGRDHPFAQTMLKHFVKLRTPLHAVGTMEQMRERFERAGWPASGIDVRSLWDLWADPEFLSPEERTALDKVEPFDEWEEFALFGSHYLLLIAEKTALVPAKQGSSEVQSLECVCESPDADSEPEGPAEVDQKYCCLPLQGMPSHRRFAAALPSDDKERPFEKVAAHGGLGTRDRLLNCDTYTHSDSTSELSPPPLAAGLICHTITAIDKSNCLLVGGRTSPDKASASCWYRKDGSWSKVHDLPEGRYRHCAVAIEVFARDACGVVVFGGKNSRGEVLDDWLLWQPSQGWKRLETTFRDLAPRNVEARFGASMTLLYDQADRGYLTGGLRRDGTVINDFWVLEFRKTDDKPIVVLENCTKQMTLALEDDQQFLGRFGAAFVTTQTSTLLVGGVAGNYFLDRKHELLDVDNRRFVEMENYNRPLLIGFTPVSFDKASHDIIVLGGGATCFSFGTYWNDSCVLRLGAKGDEPIQWRLLPFPSAVKYGQTKTTNGRPQAPSNSTQQDRPKLPPTSPKPKNTIIRRTLESAADFELIRHEGLPVILTGLDLGPCTSRWDPDYLTTQIGPDRPVVVHSSPTPHMSFHHKNFTYETQPFGAFLSAASRGAHVYLRALSSTSPSQNPTDLAVDFPTIADDFKLPDALRYVVDHAHSSPFRVSGNVTMWLHYDVLPNILCQIRGPKRLLLFAPSQVTKLGFPPGASSSAINPFIDKYVAHGYEVRLEPGDVLFLPPMWLHAAEPTAGLSVAVNVFFKDGEMEAGYAAGRDVYGNRDLAAYERGRRDIARIGKSFEGLPEEVRRFYISRLAKELGGMC